MIYYDAAGAVHWAQEPPLEPPDCWGTEEPEEEYSREEDDPVGRFDRS